MIFNLVTLVCYDIGKYCVIINIEENNTLHMNIFHVDQSLDVMPTHH